MISTLESRDYRRQSAWESQKPVPTKNKDEQPDGADANMYSSPKFPWKKCKPISRKWKQHITAVQCRTQRYCVLCKSRDNPSSVTGLTPVNLVMYLTLLRPRRTCMGFYINAILLSINSSKLIRTYRYIWRSWINRTRYCLIWPISPATTVIWTRSII